MSMIGYILRISDGQPRALKKSRDAKLLQAVLDNSRGLESARHPGTAELGEIPAALDLQYYWHMLHYLLCGEAYQGKEPFDTLLAGDEFGPELSHGKARYVTARETADFSEFLSRADFESLFLRVDLDRMIELRVYPINNGNKAEKWSDALKPHFMALRAYIAEAARTGSGYIFWIE